MIQEREIVQTVLEKPDQVMRSLLKDDLYYFLRFFWDTYQADEPFEGNWHIEKLCEELELVATRVANREPKLHDLIFNVPPGTTKTATGSIFFPIWCWIKWPWFRFITTSHSHDLSLESAEYSRDIIRSEKFRKLFPEINIKQDKDQKSNFRITYKQYYEDGSHKLKDGGGRISTSVGSKITGFHAHIIIEDDLIDPKGVLSPVKLADAIHYLDQTLSTRKVNKEVTVSVLIMQRLAQNDPTGHLLENRNNVRHICLPGEIINYEHSVKPEEYKKYYTDGLLDTKRLGHAALAELKNQLGEYGYAGQVGQDPIPYGGGMFKIDRFPIVDMIPGGIRKMVRYWDKAGTKTPTASGKIAGPAYTVGCKMALTNDGKFGVMDIVRGQWSSETREKIIKSTAEADGREVKQMVEQEPGSGGKESAEGTIRNLAGFVVEAHRPTGDKADRADPYSVQVNGGNVLLMRADWNNEYKKELEFFPYGTFKDQVDASSGAFAYLTGRIKKKAKVRRR